MLITFQMPLVILDTLLYGKSELSDESNKYIFISVQSYLIKTKPNQAYIWWKVTFNFYSVAMFQVYAH